jgi:transposase
MHHVAIDLGGKESQICRRASDGQILEEVRYPTAKLATYLKKQAPSRVILETSAEAFKIADAALELGHEVRVVPATLVPSLGVGSRGVKTDRRDAQLLSEVSTRIDLPSVHVPAEISRARKASCTAREALVAARTQLVNSVRGWSRTELLKLGAGKPATFPLRVREKALSRPEGLPEFVNQLLLGIEALTEQIAQADEDLKLVAMSDPICERLLSVPGVGPVTAVRFVAAIDDVKRFPNAHAVQCYLGLVPGEHSSSDKKRRTGITKAGSPRVRWALAQAAWSFRISRKLDPLALWANQVEARRGKKIAVTALARRLAGILYALWRDGTRYNPTRLNAPTTPAGSD